MGEGHTHDILLQITLMFIGAKAMGELFERIRQPAVVGELLTGVILGPAVLGWVKPGEFHEVLSELGVIFLLFSVGLETRVSDLLQVGTRSLWVAILGVLLPFGMGYALMHFLGHGVINSLFMGTAMVATSVGITARVLSEAGALATRAARIILGAAVIDDILGMTMLAVAAGLGSGGLSPVKIGLTLLSAFGFVGLAVVVGAPLARRGAPLMDRTRLDDGPFILSLCLCLVLAALANVAGLAAIIGAFLAGMILAETREQYNLEHQYQPVVSFLVPFFFVVTGAKVSFEGMGTLHALILLVAVVALAAAGKLIGCGLASLAEGRRTALVIGLGMVPRGEVGLIVGALGLSSGALSQEVYTIIIAMSILTTLLVPAFLRNMVKGLPDLAPGSSEGDASQLA